MILLGCLVCLVAHADAEFDDFHYPSEEPAELAAVDIPQLTSAAPPNKAVLQLKGMAINVTVGDVAFGEWHVLSVLSDSVALERNFKRWGLLTFVHKGSGPTLLRKSVGELADIKQPYFNLTGTDPHYFDKASSNLDDYLYHQAVEQTEFKELTFPSAASTLAPQRDYASISNNEDVVKFVVTYIGRVKCAVNNNTHTSPNASPIQTGGISELQDLHAPVPNDQTVVFDPAKHLRFWPSSFENTKAGLVGGHTMIANVGAFTAQEGGFELVAFAPVKSASTPLKHNPSTRTDGKSTTSNSPDSPRQPGVNYFPTALVRIREQDGTGTFNGHFSYFRVSNSTVDQPAEKIQPDEFYTALLAYHTHYAQMLGPSMMQVQLPVGDRRQVY
jgi:hypothetical protein